MTKKRIFIEEAQSGWIVTVEGFLRVAGKYVFRSDETNKMVEFVAEHTTGFKAEVNFK